MNSRLGVFLFGAALCGGLDCGAIAQTTTAIVQQPPFPIQERKKMHQIKVRNVPPSLMAWWLDPARHQEPIQIQSSRINLKNNPLMSEGETAKTEVAPLPTGIERIVPIDPQKSLLVFGTGTAVAELQKMTALLDQPLRQVEIEGKFVQITAEEAKQVGVALPSHPEKRYGAFPLSADALTLLKEWEAAGKIRIISAPRVLAINNLTADSGTDYKTEVVADIQTRAANLGASVNLSGEKGQVLTATSRGTFTVRPTLGDKNTINLQLAPVRTLELSHRQTLPTEFVSKPAEPPKADETQTKSEKEVIFSRRVLEGALIETTVQDGQTIALTGYTSQFFGDFSKKSDKPASDVLILVTTRIVRRAGDEVQPIAFKR